MITPSRDGLAENLLGHPLGVHVRRVEHRDAGLETDVHEPRRFFHVRLAPGAKKLVAAAKRARAKAEHGDLETGVTKLAIFHAQIMVQGDGPERAALRT
jgi:hypothetical protein